MIVSDEGVDSARAHTAPSRRKPAAAVLHSGFRSHSFHSARILAGRPAARRHTRLGSRHPDRHDRHTLCTAVNCQPTRIPTATSTSGYSTRTQAAGTRYTYGALPTAAIPGRESITSRPIPSPARSVTTSYVSVTMPAAHGSMTSSSLKAQARQVDCGHFVTGTRCCNRLGSESCPAETPY